MKGLTLTTKEQTRIQVLNGVMEGKVSVAEASGLMGVSERHTWRLLAAYREEGPAAVAHGNRGRNPPTTTCPQTRQKVRELTEGPYAGFNHTHLTEMLAKREGINCHAPPSDEYCWLGACGACGVGEPPGDTVDGSAIPRRGCCCRSMGAATTGFRAEDLT